MFYLEPNAVLTAKQEGKVCRKPFEEVPLDASRLPGTYFRDRRFTRLIRFRLAARSMAGHIQTFRE